MTTHETDKEVIEVAATELEKVLVKAICEESPLVSRIGAVLFLLTHGYDFSDNLGLFGEMLQKYERSPEVQRWRNEGHIRRRRGW